MIRPVTLWHWDTGCRIRRMESDLSSDFSFCRIFSLDSDLLSSAGDTRQHWLTPLLSCISTIIRIQFQILFWYNFQNQKLLILFISRSLLHRSASFFYFTKSYLSLLWRQFAALTQTGRYDMNTWDRKLWLINLFTKKYSFNIVVRT